MDYSMFGESALDRNSIPHLSSPLRPRYRFSCMKWIHLITSFTVNVFRLLLFIHNS